MSTTAKSIESYIATKTNQYVEATGRGTTGFSLEKYRATLFTLKNKVETVKEQASQLGVPYGVLRVWRTEPKFQQLAEQHQNEFYAWLTRPTRDRTNIDYLIDQFRGFFRQRDDLERVWHVYPSGIQKRLSKAKLNNAQLREYQMLSLDHAIGILSDRKTTMKYRKDLVTLLQRLKEMVK